MRAAAKAMAPPPAMTTTVAKSGTVAKSANPRLATRSAESPLQSAVGNQGVLRSFGIFPKLKVSQPDDPDERAADEMAARVTQTTGQQCSACAQSLTPCPKCAAKQIRRKASADSAANSAVSSQIGLLGSGSAMSASSRGFFEPRFNHDFGSVRIHSDGAASQAAQSIGARAFTIGNSIAFAPGEYRPDQSEGRKLLAHELTHVTQNHAAGVIHREPDPKAGAANPQPSPAPLTRPTQPHYVYRDVVMSSDEPFMRDELRRLIARRALAGYDEWFATMSREKGIQPQVSGFGPSAHGAASRPSLRSPLDAQREMADEQIAAAALPVVIRLYPEIRAEATKFLDEFELRSKVVMTAMLDISEEKIQAEQKRYGLKTSGTPLILVNPQMTKQYGPTDYLGAGYSIQEGPAKKGLQGAATKLAAQLRTYSKKWGEKFRYMGIMNNGMYGVPYVKDEAGHARWQKDFDDFVFTYQLDRAAKIAEFPILASFAPSENLGTAGLDQAAEKLEGMATGSTPDLAETLNKEANEKLANVYKTRWALDQGELSIWNLDSIVKGTKNALGLQPGSMQEKLVDEKAAAVHRRETYIKIAIAAIALILGILAALPTGGSSLAAGVAVAAAVGSATLSVTMAYSDLKEYLIQSAASGTDFEKAQAISHDDPSMFWLALSIIGAGLDLGAAVGAFKALGPAARRMREAKRLQALGKLTGEEEAAARVAREQLIKDSQKYPGLAQRIEAHVGLAAGDEARNAERLGESWRKGLNPETLARIDEPAFKLYKDMDPVIRDFLTHCASVCLIPNITHAQYSQIKDIVYAHGVEELGGLKQYFHFRRNDLTKAINELKAAEKAEGLAGVKKLLGDTLTAAPLQAEEDAIAAWARLTESKATTESKADFIEKYKAGLRYDEGARTWYNPVKGLKDAVPLSASASEALHSFKNSEGFASFQKLLQDEKLIAGEEDLIKALDAMKPSFRGRPVDSVRHALKDVYREALLAKMSKPDPVLMRVRYPELPWANAEEAMRQASYQEMRRMTDNLAVSDKGNLFERWYKAVLSPTGVEHVEIEAAKLQALGSKAGKNRILDLLEGDAIHELKRIAGPMGEHDLSQFLDNMLMVSKKLDVGGKPLQRAIYTFPIPEGVQANAKWMRQQLATYKGTLTFEVFNAGGQRRILNDAAELNQSEFWTWLGLAMK